MALKNKVVLLASVAFAGSATPAFAYLDPGTGSIILQSIIGGFVVFASMVSMYWQRFKSLFVRKKTDNLDGSKGR